MTVSTRTPEGFPFHCHVCGWNGFMERSQPIGDATCPCCGALVYSRILPIYSRVLVKLAMAVVSVVGIIVVLWCALGWFGLGNTEGVVVAVLLFFIFSPLLVDLGRLIGSSMREIFSR